MILRTIIVDDEEVARERLGNLLATRHDVKVVGEADCIAYAAPLCASLRPDLIFLDVQMPKGDGFSLLEKLDPPLPAIIFVTAFDKYALRAFEINAVDYLLKPVNRDRLSHALERVVHRPPPAKDGILLESDRVFLESPSRTRVAFVTEICGIEAKGNYTRVILADGTTEFLRKKIAEWESRLPASIFVRGNRSVIVNLKHVRKVVRTGRGTLSIEAAGFPELISLGRDAGTRFLVAFRQLEKV